jgi:hypothetical protein
MYTLNRYGTDMMSVASASMPMPSYDVHTVETIVPAGI